MRKRVCFIAFVLLIMSGYLIVLAYPGPPNLPTWTPGATALASRTVNGGVFLNVYTSVNLVKATQPQWNYRSYHWACASNLGAKDIGFEFRHDAGVGEPHVRGPFYDEVNGDTHDENGTSGIWENDWETCTLVVRGGPPPNQVQAYSEIWSPGGIGDRNEDNNCKAQTDPYTVPEW